MSNIRLIKRRIKSAGNIAQITKAMELVAASKMKKAQSQALNGKLYAQKIYGLVFHLAEKANYTDHPLLKKPEKLVGRKLIILLSTNKGLCGGLNNNLFRYLSSLYANLANLDFITLGNKGAEFLNRLHANVLADFSSSQSFIESVPALTEMITEKYLSNQYDSVELVFSEFLSALKQSPSKRSLLPLTINLAQTDEVLKIPQFLIEPSVPEVFNALLPHYLENQIRDAVLQAQASEYSSRMIAMHNATDNALSLTSELTLMYNKARQERITSEIAEIVTARLAVEG